MAANFDRSLEFQESNNPPGPKAYGYTDGDKYPLISVSYEGITILPQTTQIDAEFHTASLQA